MASAVPNKHDLARAKGTGTATCEGYLYGDTKLSFFWADLPQGVALDCIAIPVKQS